MKAGSFVECIDDKFSSEQLQQLSKIPKDIDGAYYLVHSMSASSDYQSLEEKSSINFRTALNKTNVQHVVYLSGIVNEDQLSKHLASRKSVEIELNKASGFIRNELSKSIHLKRLPSIRFTYDDTAERSQRIENILKGDSSH